MSQITEAYSRLKVAVQAAAGPASVRGRWSGILLLSAATFLFWAALHIYVPILPSYAESLGASLAMVGAVIASYAIAQLLLRAPLGVWADFLGRRKPFVVAGLLAASVGALVMGAAPGPCPLFAGRAVTGVAATTWVVSSVFFSAYFAPERAARGIGIISFVNSSAMVAATYLGGQLAELWGPQAVFFVAALLGVVGILFMLPVTEPDAPPNRALSREALVRVAFHPLLLVASLISVLVHFASASTISSFSLVYAGRIGASPSDLGTISAAYLGSATLATLAAVYLVERRGYSSTIMLGAAVMGVALIVTPLITEVRLFEGLQIINGAGRGLINTALMALSISSVPPHQRATAMGIYQALYAIGMLLGPILGGVVAERAGMASVFYMAGASALIAGVLAYLRIVPRRPEITGR